MTPAAPRRPRAKGSTGPAGDLRVLLATAPARDARRIAGGLVEAGVAACATLLPGATSVYRWKGRVETARETVLVVKTTRAGLARCLGALADAHPYEVPEGLAWVPDRALAAYAAWVRESVLRTVVARRRRQA